MKKILIINAWGGNRGDEAMLNTLGRLIRRHVGDCSMDYLPFCDEVIDLEPDIKWVGNRCGAYYYSARFLFLFRALSFIKKKIKNLGLRKKINNCLSVETKEETDNNGNNKKQSSAVEKPESGIQKLSARSIFEAFIGFIVCGEFNFLKDYDFIFSAPQGSTINDEDQYKYRILLPLFYAKRFSIPYFILGVSMGPFSEDSYRDKWTKDILAGARKIIVREDISLRYVQEKYPDMKNISSAIDIVYSEASNIDKKNDNSKQIYYDFIKKINDGCIGACISITPTAGGEDYFNLEKHIQNYKYFFEHVIEKTDKDLILFSHLKYDEFAVQKLKKEIKYNNKVWIFPIDLDSDFQQEFIKKLSFYISTRYHPTIFAIKGQVPFFCIKNYFKTEGMLQKLKLDIYTSRQSDSLDSLKKQFINAWLERQVIKDKERLAEAIIKENIQAYHETISQLNC